MGDSIGIASALATVVRGGIGDGLSQLDANLRRAQSTSFVLPTDNTAVAIAYAANVLGDDDITLELLNTGCTERASTSATSYPTCAAKSTSR